MRRILRKQIRALAIVVVVALLFSSLPLSSGKTQSRTAPAQQSQSFAAQLYGTVTTTVTSIGSWMASFIETEAVTPNTYHPVAAYLTPAPPFIDEPTNLTVTAASSTSINLSWTAPSGTVDHYIVERSENIEGPFSPIANVTGVTTKNDTTVTNLHAYLYRVRAVSSTGAVSAPSNMALGTAISFLLSSLANQEIRAQHFHDVRTAINAVRPVANLTVATWTRGTLTNLVVNAADVNEMRSALDAALTALSIPVTAYTDPTLSVGANGTLIKAIHIEQLQTRSTSGSSTSSGPINSDSSTARLDPLNETGGGGENPLSRNFNWNLPLLSLPGRAGMDLGLTLSYNSLVWTKIGSNAISFDDDNGFPGPGFRLGFPVIQQRYFNSEVGKQAYLLIGPDGSRTELRQVGTSTFYEAGDSSHLVLDESVNPMILRTTDGTQLSYALHGGEFQCTQIKDRNGNFITVSYNAAGRINTITDTLNRVITFNYTNGWLMSITQSWKQHLQTPVTHYWARFEYTDKTIDTNFPGLTVFGPADTTNIKTLTKVTLADDSRFEFNYTSWGQVWKVTSFAPDNSVLNYRTYDLPQTGTLVHNDCPRFTVRKDWAKYWNGDTDGTTSASEEVATSTFIVPVSDNWTMPDNTPATGVRAEVTTPDGTVNKIYFVGTAGSDLGWQRGLPALVETYSGVQWMRKVMTTWTQDDETSPFVLNPRIKETNVYDPDNHARTEVDYGASFDLGNGMSCHLPRVVFEYAANASTKLRSTRTTYNMTAPYKDRRILGLVSIKELFEGDVTGTLKAKVSFFYDNENGSTSIQGTDAPVQHDNTNYTASFVSGRANLSSVQRFNVANLAESTTTRTKYNTAGAVVFTKDASDHETTISYADVFSDGTPRNTLAYPTKVTDPDTFEATSKYDFDFGAVTSQRTPKPNETTNVPELERPEQLLTFDSIGRPDQITNSVNGASIRFEYSPAGNQVDTYKTIQQGLGEARSFEITDGHGRVVGRAKTHPSSTTPNAWSADKLVYDVMGRISKTYNPVETMASGPHAQWTPIGDDLNVAWPFSQQTYDWNGRPLITTHQNDATRTASYAGCGCAGGEVVTLTDEGGAFDGSQWKKRQQKIYSDVLGRTRKTEILNWENGSVYSTTVNTYNARDQVTEVKEYAGPEGSPTFQVTTLNYDGFGRLERKHIPQQLAGADTVWTYNADDTVQSITDARGATQTFAYNDRHQTISIVYGGVSPGTATVTYEYDAAGNRTLMTDGLGSKSYQYDDLSRLTTETRNFAVGSFPINYSYNLAGQLSGLTDPFGQSFTYVRNVQGQLKSLTGSPYAGTTSYVTDVTYRAWGAPKVVTFAGGATATTTYTSRMQPSTYRHLASNGGSVMREDYSYFPDGRVASLTDLDDTIGANPPATLRFMSRQYSYDHVGRVTGAGGTGIVSMPSVPLGQNYGYDAFGNMTSRTGSYYNYNLSPPATDSSTYVNNRRSNWAHNAEGQVTSTPFTSTDMPRTMTYDAAGRRVTSVETGSDTTITYSASYDGDGRLSFESTNNSLLGQFDSSYIVRSTVLAGEVLTRLNGSGGKLITHVPAEGMLFATQRSSGGPGAFVMFTHRNPLGLTETTRALYDPLGNFIPFRSAPDPRPPAGSYNSGSMSGLASSQANPDSLAVGCVLDGIPSPCNKVSQALDRLPIDFDKSSIRGLAVNPWIMRLMASFQLVETRREDVDDPRRLPPSETKYDEDGKPYEFHGLPPRKVTIITMEWVKAPGGQDGSEQNRFPFRGKNLGDFEKAYELASSALFTLECAREITGSGHRWAGLYANGQLGSIAEAENFKNAGPGPISSRGTPILASTHNPGDGGRAVINIYDEFFDEGFLQNVALAAGATIKEGKGFEIAGIPRISPAVAMAIVILHELRHAITGKKHKKGEKDKERNAWDLRIFRACFPELQGNKKP